MKQGNRRVAARALICCLTGAGLSLSAAGVFAQAPTDHLKCYVANEISLEPPIVADLEDQFGPRPGVLVHNAGWFCNPAAKTIENVNTPILEPNNHLTLYPISRKSPETRRLVTIRNQFGEQELVLTAPRLLAVPTRKAPFPPPVDISHFECYEARSPSLDLPLTLRDQFEIEEVRVLSATFFCNPAAKTVDEVTTPPEPEEAHLTCYKVAPSGNPQTPEFIDVSNQIDTEDSLKIGPSEYLCVPSEKLSVRTGGRMTAEEEPAGTEDPPLEPVLL